MAKASRGRVAVYIDFDNVVISRSRKDTTRLLRRAMELLAKNDLEWQHASTVKNQMKRMDPSFQERPLGHGQFSDFLKSRQSIIEIDKSKPTPLRWKLKV